MSKILRIVLSMVVLLSLAHSQSTTTSTDKRKNMLDVILRNLDGTPSKTSQNKT